MLTGEHPVHEYRHRTCTVRCLVTGEQWRQNTYIVDHRASRTTIVIDPGDNPERIIRLVDDGGGELTRILLTHPHHDHIGAAEQVSNHYRLPCELHRLDARLLAHAPMYALRFAHKRLSPVSSFRYFEELPCDDGISFLRSIHTPGHTKGSVCYLFDDFVLTGDTLMFRHVGRTDLPGSSAEEITSSVDRLVRELPPETAIYPGHGKPWRIDEALAWWQELHGTPPEHRNFIDIAHEQKASA